MKLKGVHRVRARGRTYYYAWRGGPPLPGDPEASEEAAAAYFRIRGSLKAEPKSPLFAAAVKRFQNGAEHKSRSILWRRECEALHEILMAEFGEAAIETFEDKRARADVKDFRDRFAETPRQADKIVGELAAILSWLEDRGEIGPHIVRKIGRLAESDRSEIVWETAEIEAVCAHLVKEAKALVWLAAHTGLDLGDLCLLPWSAVGTNDIQWNRRKTGQRAIIPILPAARAIIDGLPKRGPVMLTSSRGGPWTASGFESSFQRAKKKAKIEGKRFKDLRGTAATNFLLGGLSYAETGVVMGWSEKDVERIARRYVHRGKIASATVARLARNAE